MSSNNYTWKVAFTYIFNLLFGAGALALPKAFAEAGVLLGSLTLLVLVAMSYCACTFIVEVMAIVNALRRHRDGRHWKGGGTRHCSSSSAEDETDQLLDEDEKMYIGAYYNNNVGRKDGYEEITSGNEEDQDVELDDPHIFEITSKVEVGDMASLFFPKIGIVMFYSVIALYLYGALSIYASGISKCLTTVVCGDTQVFEGDVAKSCPRVPHISIMGIYRCMLALVALGLGPFTFMNMSSAKLIQVRVFPFLPLFRKEVGSSKHVCLSVCSGLSGTEIACDQVLVSRLFLLDLTERLSYCYCLS